MISATAQAWLECPRGHMAEWKERNNIEYSKCTFIHEKFNFGYACIHKLNIIAKHLQKIEIKLKSIMK